MVAIALVVTAVAVLIATRSKPDSYVLGSARSGTVTETVAVSGALQPTRSWNLYFPTSGTVATVLVSPGEHVHKGQVLAVLDAGSLQAQVSSAQAAVTADEAKLSADQAKLDSDQAKQDAHPAKTSAQSTANSALITADQNALTADQNAQTAAERQLTTAQANLSAATLRAPSAATVAQVNVTAGQNIGNDAGSSQTGSGAGDSNQANTASSADMTTGGSSAAIALMNGSLQALGQVSDSQIAQVHVGQRALVTPAGETTAISGRVQAITPTPNNSDGVVTYPIQIDWSGHHRGVFDGMSAQVSIIVAKATGMTVPSSAVHTSGTQSWVLVVRGAHERNGKARGGQVTRQTIKVGPSGGGLTIVRSGLHPGEQVMLADNSTPLPSSSSSSQKGSGKNSQVRKLLG